MPGPKAVEINEPSAPKDLGTLRQHLINASNEIYLFELESQRSGREVPDALRRAHTSIRAELRRIEAELGVS